MAFDFPSSPSDGEVFTPSGGPSYTYNAAGTKWLVSATTFTGQPLDALLTSIAAQAMVADRYIYGTGTDAVTLGTITSFARTILDDAAATDVLTTLGIVTGIYTPVLTNVANLDASTANTAGYILVGNRVLVFGIVSADATAAAATATTLGVSLPVASALVSSIQLAGAGIASDNTGIFISGDGTNDRANFAWLSGTTTNRNISFIFSYQVI